MVGKVQKLWGRFEKFETLITTHWSVGEMVRLLVVYITSFCSIFNEILDILFGNIIVFRLLHVINFTKKNFILLYK